MNIPIILDSSVKDNMEIEFAQESQGLGSDSLLDSRSIQSLEKWIEDLMNCKPLSEDDVERLCNQVGAFMLYRCELQHEQQPIDRILDIGKGSDSRRSKRAASCTCTCTAAKSLCKADTSERMELIGLLEMSCHSLWRYTRPVSRSNRIVPH